MYFLAGLIVFVGVLCVIVFGVYRFLDILKTARNQAT